MKHFGQDIPGIATPTMIPLKLKSLTGSLQQKGKGWSIYIQRPGVATSPMMPTAEKKAIAMALRARR